MDTQLKKLEEDVEGLDCANKGKYLSSYLELYRMGIVGLKFEFEPVSLWRILPFEVFKSKWNSLLLILTELSEKFLHEKEESGYLRIFFSDLIHNINSYIKDFENIDKNKPKSDFLASVKEELKYLEDLIHKNSPSRKSVGCSES